MNKQDKKFLIEMVRNLLIEASVNSFYKKQYSKKMSYDDYMIICHLDPTTNGDNMGKYCLWLLREIQTECKREGGDIHEYIQENYANNEDLTTLLSLYDKNKGRIKSQYPEYADITKISLSQFYTFIIQKKDEFESKSLTQSKSKDAECVYDDKDWQIIIPYTWEASKKYGANTKWCTTDKDDDMFFQKYSRSEPLFINIDKNTGRKYQFSLLRHCFFDEKDNSFANDINTAARKINMPQDVLDFYQNEASKIIKQYKEARGLSQTYQFSAYDMGLQLYNATFYNHQIMFDRNREVIRKVDSFLYFLSLCSKSKLENDAQLYFEVYDELEERTVDEFGNELDSETKNALEDITIFFNDFRIDADSFRRNSHGAFYYTNLDTNEEFLIMTLADGKLDCVSITAGEEVYAQEMLSKMGDATLTALNRVCPSKEIAQIRDNRFNINDAIHVMDNIYWYEFTLYRYNGNKPIKMLTNTSLEDTDLTVENIYYANEENGIIIFVNSRGKYVILVNGLDDSTYDFACENGGYYYDDEEIYGDEKFFNSWQILFIMGCEPSIFKQEDTSNIAFNIGCYAFFSINNEHYILSQIAEEFNGEAFLLADDSVISIYCGEIDSNASKVRMDSGDKYVYVYHDMMDKDENNYYVNKIDIFNGEKVNNDFADADNFYQEDPYDEYSYRMAENIKKNFNILLEKISQNYNADKKVK